MNTAAQKVPDILAFGDSAFLVEFGNQMDRAVSERVLALNDKLSAAKLPGLTESVPTFRSLLVKYDPLVTRFSKLKQQVTELLSDVQFVQQSGKHWEIPVCYETDFAPDLEEVASRTGTTTDKVVDLHSSVDYHIYMVGFVAGCPYLGDVPEELSLPRRSEPRLRVPLGSIAIALSMTIVYPLISPGGWHLIGKTPISIFDLDWSNPALFSPGDKVNFTPIDSAEFTRINDAVCNDGYRLTPVD